ncbi:hypothetical protein [Piscinibacter sp. HJYY11]|uniref:hypothetical protein n=1 Tax=Piscinibacter sp. HJYY11 TaxID=2801333 RepID=UPI00191D20FC|nr:hypothetical protein [Piscinibacter sp. HJYY11]MBL0729940.1 hypothetical protein [Piscinibacter sp. HJYY11]
MSMLPLMEDINASLNKLSLLQMICAWAFVACYALALGGMLEARGARRAAALAVIAAALFCALGDNWVHGALLVTFAVAGMGLFVAVAWALARSVAWTLARGTPTRPTPAAPAKAKPQPIGVMLRDLWRSQA